MITPRTTGIIGVHLWGRGAAHAELQAIADEHNLKLMYDAAHAFGCSLGGRMIGHFGACEVFSFHATKFFNTFEGGAVVTNDDALADKMRLMRNFGFAGFDDVIYPGTNGKMVEVCAAMGLSNLECIDSVIAANRRNYEAYRQGINAIDGLSLFSYDDRECNNYQYVVLEVGENFAASRDEIITALHAENILARKYFWPGCHGMKPYRDLFPHARLMLTNTEKVANRVIVLPTGTTIDSQHSDIIIDVLSVLAKN
jgi:dTDP-4-amino-4,6-dideoxygalactose transaminase